MRTRVLLPLPLTAFALAAALAAQSPARSVNEKVFTDGQAKRGQEQFQTHCSMCHDPGRFQGPGFIDGWSNRPLQDLFDLMRGSMPEDNPGSLREEQYADVLAYFLHLNGYPAGDAELTSAEGALKAIRLDAPQK